MHFEGEHLLIGKIGHFFVLLAFVSSLLATISNFTASKKVSTIEGSSWLNLARWSYLLQTVAVLVVFTCIFIICSNHYIEYLYAYKHTSKELEFKYLFASIWEDQGGSFLLWSIWNSVLGLFFIARNRKDAGRWEAPVMTIFSLAQVFLAMMIMGVYFFDVKIGNSPFVLTRNEINGPIFSMPEYLSMIKDGIGLNVLLRNYWMVIHPPVLFLGFSATIIPFAYAYAGLFTNRHAEWIKPAIPYTIFASVVLGVGIMMGGKWAYESLSFGGYWAWDPVENASLVPWLILVSGLHTMIIFKATGHSLKATYLFSLLAFIFVLYSTFLTRTGILGDTSVHAFTEAGKAMNILILTFLLAFTIPSLVLFFVKMKGMPAELKEETTDSREFWMFIGSLILFLSGIFIIAKTSVPVVNAIFGTKFAPPEDVEFSYNKVMVLVAVLVGLLSAVGQYFKFKKTEKKYFFSKIAIPTIIALVITLLFVFFYPIGYIKQGIGFLIAIYVALFATIYSTLANGMYIWTSLKGKMLSAGGSITHLGFAVMLVGILISAGNKKIISEEKFKNFAIPMGIDPLTKQQDNPAENINLIREVPNKMHLYTVTYTGDSAGHETGRRFYHLKFEKKDDNNKVVESFVLSPDVYMMKGGNMSSNPDTKGYLTHDVFTYISYALDPEKNEDTAQFKIHEIKPGDTLFYSKGFMVLNEVVKNPATNKYNVPLTGPAAMAKLTVQTNDSSLYTAAPMILVDSAGIKFYDDTLYAPNLYVKFAGVTEDQQKIKIGVKESEKLIDFVTIKSFIFPYINLVWVGLIVMAFGFMISIIKRANANKNLSLVLIAIVSLALCYMFFFAN